jgi:hypothetical protein
VYPVVVKVTDRNSAGEMVLEFKSMINEGHEACYGSTNEDCTEIEWFTQSKQLPLAPLSEELATCTPLCSNFAVYHFHFHHLPLP